jgi:DNA-nicking Smr family endonuclease
MSDKKNNKEKFNNPFSSLEGLSVSAQQQVDKKPAPVASEPLDPTHNATSEEEVEVDFFSEMSGLGVRQIEQGGLEKPEPRHDDATVETEKEDQVKTPTSGGGGVAQARREKRLRRGDVQPQAELDLHGVKADAVQEKVGWFLENAVFHGFEAVRIITGKGSRSETGPVLRPLVEAYLDGAGRTLVVEWLRAPQRQGGEGAIIVFLRV